MGLRGLQYLGGQGDVVIMDKKWKLLFRVQGLRFRTPSKVFRFRVWGLSDLKALGFGTTNKSKRIS